MKAFNSIDELQHGLIWKEYSIAEVLDSYFTRIHSKDTELNAFITLTQDYAYSRAKSLQKVLDDNPESISEYPLLGVPIAVKDIYLTKGIRTTAASNVLSDYVPAYSSSAFANLEKAGAILVGKANCDAWAHGSSGENSDFGPTKNPWNKDYVPGGSSSGSAVSVAADFALVSPGSDTCGSVRLPANYCGLVGLKPTYGAVSRYGVIAMASSIDTMGHITRTASDGLSVFRITRGLDGLDGTLVNAEYKKYTKRNLKIGLPKEFLTDDLHPDVQGTLEEFKKCLQNAGHELVEVKLPTTKHAISVYYIVQTAEVSSNLGRFDGVRYGAGRDRFGSEAKRRIMLGSYVLSSGYYDAYYDKAQRVRTLLINEVKEVFESVDVLLAPVAPTPPFKLGEKAQNPLEMYLTDIFAATANLTGIPAVAFPTGKNKSGFPLGVQLMGPKFSEEILYGIVEEYQKKTSWHTMRP